MRAPVDRSTRLLSQNRGARAPGNARLRRGRSQVLARRRGAAPPPLPGPHRPNAREQVHGEARAGG
jgi:hypothetical protein